MQAGIENLIRSDDKRAAAAVKTNHVFFVGINSRYVIVFSGKVHRNGVAEGISGPDVGRFLQH